MSFTRRAFVLSTCAMGMTAPMLQACGHGARMAGPLPPTRETFTNLPYATWNDDDPAYRLYPGDEIDVAVPSAPELARSVKVAPDGRVALPLIGAMMAADRTTEGFARELERAYASQLVRPAVEVSLKLAAPVKVFVGGEVGLPGVYEMGGDIDALQAVILAGGFKPYGRPGSVVILRRGPDGRAMMRTVDLSRALKTPATDRVPLRRFDIVYVPRSSVGEVAAYMTVLRDALPVSFSYALTNPYKA
jgi:polysaccharide export outer membrane protein